MINENNPFPDFDLEDQDGRRVTLNDLKGAPAVLFFYPKDDTSGCTVEACGFRDTLPNLFGVRVIGVSPDGVKSHRKFADKYGLNYTLLADTKQALCKAVGVWVEKSMYGRKYMGVERTTFLLDERGNVVKVWRKVKPEGHADEVREALQASLSNV